MKRVVRYIRNICRAFPINILINEVTDNDCLKYIIYLFFLPVEMGWFLFFWISGEIMNALKKIYTYKWAVVSIIKNEALYLEEWIVYHNKVCGVEHFYLFNNNSNDNTEQVLKKYINSGLVTLINFPGNQRQVDAYNYTILKYRKDVKYLMVIDADEFLQVTDHTVGDAYTIIDTLMSGKNVGTIGINWCMFGSSNKMVYENQLVIERFKYTALKNDHSNHYVKSIINPRLCVGFYRAHFGQCFPGHIAVDCLGERIFGSLTDTVNHFPLRLNHYFTKSKEEFEKKRGRGMADQLGKRNKNNFEMYDLNNVFDDSMDKYVSVVKDGIYRNDPIN